ncbi:uncharacterized protein LOC111403356 [Olea europaea var. sylvestris]|uniref:uncharacterized protein LOC111403356 n=1 Tax=Olea europaea var. sylvestris TaxID=158386 RepID=UPI000C1D0EF9|nr:uncharacterized protein LOC111403356 [Olea europaea var. sylvestris]
MLTMMQVECTFFEAPHSVFKFVVNFSQLKMCFLQSNHDVYNRQIFFSEDFIMYHWSWIQRACRWTRLGKVPDGLVCPVYASYCVPAEIKFANIVESRILFQQSRALRKSCLHNRESNLG